MTAVLRPGQDAQLHQAWQTWHKTLGKGALALALVNIFIGLTIGQAPIPYYIWQALVVIGLFMVVSRSTAMLHPCIRRAACYQNMWLMLVVVSLTMATNTHWHTDSAHPAVLLATSCTRRW